MTPLTCPDHPAHWSPHCAGCQSARLATLAGTVQFCTVRRADQREHSASALLDLVVRDRARWGL